MNDDYVKYKKYKIRLCSNCEGRGHIYKNCIYPITSYGIICIKSDSINNTINNNTADDNTPNNVNVLTNLNIQDKMHFIDNIRYLLIQRKHSMGYVEIIRGKYNINNIGYLKIMLSIMTTTEKHNILTNDFKNLWDELWINRKYNDKYGKEYKDAYNKFTSFKQLLIDGNELYNLEYLIKESGDMWSEPEWGFPKGRKNHKESKIECALREFKEETGISLNTISLLDIEPKNEIFIGTNGIIYKHVYYFAIYIGNDNNNILNVDIHNNLQYAEVSKIKWMTLSEALENIRPYNTEKINILNDTANILTDFIASSVSK